MHALSVNFENALPVARSSVVIILVKSADVSLSAATSLQVLFLLSVLWSNSIIFIYRSLHPYLQLAEPGESSPGDSGWARDDRAATYQLPTKIQVYFVGTIDKISHKFMIVLPLRKSVSRRLTDRHRKG